MSIEDRLAKWLEQPGTFVTRAEQQFISDMRNAAVDGVGYGWMQQVIEWEWQSEGPASHGPEYYHAEIERLQAALREVRAVAQGGSHLERTILAVIETAISGKGET